ncbi:MAG: DUF1800 domain-containing protein [Planctomycetota bacterium]
MISVDHAAVDELVDLAPFEPSARDPFDHRRAAHLLRRAGFGGSPGEVERAVADGLAHTVERLVESDDRGARVRDLESVRDVVITLDDLHALQAWWVQRMVASEAPLREKLALFWHGHFATSHAKVQSVALMARQLALFDQHAFGPIDELALAISRDPAMLRWLDSRSNHKRHPNENYARELMELFLLGIGHYDEHDVQEAARAFTGWHEQDGEFHFDPSAHDGGDKTVFGRSGAWDGDDIVRLCLEHEAAPRFLATRLLRHFLHPEPPAAAIEAFARAIVAHDFDLRAPLSMLFRSRAFFTRAAYRALVKSPVELLVGALRVLELRDNGKVVAETLAHMGQALFSPPTVKGWEGNFAWITPTSWLVRANALSAVAEHAALKVTRVADAIAVLLDGELERDVVAARAPARDAVLTMLPEFHLA